MIRLLEKRKGKEKAEKGENEEGWRCKRCKQEGERER